MSKDSAYVLYVAYTNKRTGGNPLVYFRGVSLIASCSAGSMEEALKKFGVQAKAPETFFMSVKADYDCFQLDRADPFKILRVEMPMSEPNWYMPEGDETKFFRWYSLTRVSRLEENEEKWFVVEQVPHTL